jgi:hypothetical protein
LPATSASMGTTGSIAPSSKKQKLKLASSLSLLAV